MRVQSIFDSFYISRAVKPASPIFWKDSGNDVEFTNGGHDAVISLIELNRNLF